MIIYNVTVKVEHSISSDWLDWLKKEHIPDIIATGCFTNASIFHLHEADDEEGITYAIQYHAETQSAYEKYIGQFSEIMKQRSFDKWGNRFIAFRTVMQSVN